MNKLFLFIVSGMVVLGMVANAEPNKRIITSQGDAAVILSNSKCFRADGSSTKLSDKIFGYIAVGLRVRQIVLSNGQLGGKERSSVIYDIDLTFAGEPPQSFNLTFKGCTAD